MLSKFCTLLVIYEAGIKKKQELNHLDTNVNKINKNTKKYAGVLKKLAVT